MLAILFMPFGLLHLKGLRSNKLLYLGTAHFKQNILINHVSAEAMTNIKIVKRGKIVTPNP
jgi:hypothetical protein